ncbi:hypothetical protein Cpir12675_006275 [Ceratocystis pirilliformis]|uniref:Uncharacterized protein n=1 Tax=Ceratocystis pirilliformis TaxID=259994 RepID=A0ABR3YLA7_9PEZI
MQFSAVAIIFAALAVAHDGHSHSNTTMAATGTGAASGTGAVTATSVPTAGAAQIAAPLVGLLAAALAL